MREGLAIMMRGLGIDLLKTGRIVRELAQGEWQSGEGIFTPGEVAFCRAGSDPARRFAACFAAKEATLKALGVEVNDLAMFLEVEVKAGSRSGFEIELRDRLKKAADRSGVQRVHLSMACDSFRTGAIIILEA